MLNAAVLRTFVRRFEYPTLFAASLCLCAFAPLGRAAVINLTDNNSQAKLDPATQAGMFFWGVQNGAVVQNQLHQQWFWYRVDGTAEQSIDTISAPVISAQTANTVTTTYNDGLGRFNLSIRYSLVGGAPGSGTADITEQITINNTSGTVLPYHFFQYSDFDMAGTAGSDFVALSVSPVTLKFNQSDQIDGSNIAEVVTSPNANHAEADFVPNTLVKLNDGAPTTLDDTKTSAGLGDVAWAFQWDVNIGVGSSFIISKDKHLDVTLVPEPVCAALISCGLCAFGILKRRPR